MIPYDSLRKVIFSMERTDEYIMINLKDILFYALRRWKSIFVVAVILALLLGAFQAVNEYNTIINTDKETDYWIEYHQYQDKLALAEDRVSSTQGKIDTLQDYMDHAVLMKADYRNVYVANATYYIDSDYKIMPELNYQNPDKTYTLTWYYLNYLNDYSLYEAISAEVGIESKYLMDLVSIKTTNNDTLSLSVFHPYQHDAECIMEALQNQLLQVHAHLEKTITEHSLTQMLNTCGVYVDESLKEKQHTIYDDMLKYQEELIKHTEALRDLKKEGEPNPPSVPKTFVKWFILGGILGCALMGIFFVCKALFNGRVHFHGDLTSRYVIPMLGCVVSGSKKYDFISKFIRKLEGRQLENTEENQQFLAENLRRHCKEHESILIVSDVSSEESQIVSNALSTRLANLRFMNAGSLTKDPVALRLLSECNAVIFAVTAEHSRYKDISAAIEVLRSCESTVLGFVFIDR